MPASVTKTTYVCKFSAFEVRQSPRSVHYKGTNKHTNKQTNKQTNKVYQFIYKDIYIYIYIYIIYIIYIYIYTSWTRSLCYTVLWLVCIYPFLKAGLQCSLRRGLRKRGSVGSIPGRGIHFCHHLLSLFSTTNHQIVLKFSGYM